MWAPGRIPAGTETDAFTTTMDLLPTVAKLAGVPLKTRGPIDGLDISAVIHGEDTSPRTEMLYDSARGALKGLRRGDWKIFSSLASRTSCICFYLKDDVGERTDLAKKMPEKVAGLEKRMLELDGEIADNVRPRGQFKKGAIGQGDACTKSSQPDGVTGRNNLSEKSVGVHRFSCGPMQDGSSPVAHLNGLFI